MGKIIINPKDKKAKINKNIYGHFSEHLGRCIYQGLYVGEESKIPNTKGMRNDVVEALKNIRVPVLRWPGGCFADEYHWKDGIGPKEKRKKMINTHWGGVVEDNSFGTHEFFELCSQIGCDPYVNGNVGSGTVQEMSEWVEYMTFGGLSPMSEQRSQNGNKEPWKLKYFGVGNENWGCGGNMRPEFYADNYRRYQTYVRNYDDNQIYKIACGPNSANYEWTEKLMKYAAPYMDALTLHHYTVTGDRWEDKDSALGFDTPTYYRTLKQALVIEELISNHLKIMDRYDPEHKVDLIVDEWGTWFLVEPGTNPGFLYQQNTMRDAMVASLTLDIFNKHSDRIVMANIAQTVNVLQAVILTEGEKMILTPTYHVFDLYKEHQDATLVHSYAQTEMTGSAESQIPAMSVSSSVKDDNTLVITLTNTDAKEKMPAEIEILTEKIGKISSKILCGDIGDYNDFDHPNDLYLEDFTDIKANGNNLVFTMPPCSIMNILVDLS